MPKDFPLPPVSTYRPIPAPPPYAHPPRKRWPSYLLLGALTLTIGLCALLILAGALFAFVLPHLQPASPVDAYTPVPTVPPLKVYNVTGKPTLDPKFIDNVLAYYDSPAAGKGQALYDYGVQYHINPAYALAFFLEESNFGTKGVATKTHALGNIRATAGEPQYKGYRSYPTWEAGFEDWYRLISEKYVAQWNLVTVDQIVPVYAPSFDNNNEKQYIRTIKFAIERWRNGNITV
jgi:hypothetical protein